VKRILITGSRIWIDRAWIAEELDQAAAGLGADQVTVVSGACPQGADRICEEYATARGWIVERHRADWNAHGKAAGFIRNQAMVDLGADACVVFVRQASRGATHCGQAAERAGIPTVWIKAE
jgi:hypothetical protein